MTEQTVLCAEREFILRVPEGASAALCRVERQADAAGGVPAEYELTLKAAQPVTGPVVLQWSCHMAGVLSYWSPTALRERGVPQWWHANVSHAELSLGAPLLAVIGQGRDNFCTAALSDAERPLRMTFAVNDFEEKEHLDFCVYLFESESLAGEYTVRLRLDERAVPYEDAIADAVKWWENFYPPEKPDAPSSELPLYSSWYNYHQHPEQASLEKEMVLAAEMGFKALIIDDGWSYDGNGPGDYRFCGDWKLAPSKFPDFGAFVEKVHRLGIKAAVWFPVPFVGHETADHARFAGKYLYDAPQFSAAVLDPRYPEVRRYITDAYTEMMRRYGVDGLKLDFLNAFHADDPAMLCTDKAPGADCETVEQGVIRLLREIRIALTAIRPDCMIEFRQYYVGPAITRHCNMLRVGDCAFDCITNRIGVVDLRLMGYDLAVHADMLLWAGDETAENCAVMLLNILFAVPQISVLLQRSTPQQLAVLRRYVTYWTENRALLLHGRLRAPHPECNYPLVSSENAEKRIAAAYAETLYRFDGKQTDLFNAADVAGTVVENGTDGAVTAVWQDCFGTLCGSRVLAAGECCRLPVPLGGMVVLTAGSRKKGT